MGARSKATLPASKNERELRRKISNLNAQLRPSNPGSKEPCTQLDKAYQSTSDSPSSSRRIDFRCTSLDDISFKLHQVVERRCGCFLSAPTLHSHVLRTLLVYLCVRLGGERWPFVNCCLGIFPNQERVSVRGKNCHYVAQ